MLLFCIVHYQRYKCIIDKVMFNKNCNTFFVKNDTVKTAGIILNKPFKLEVLKIQLMD